MNPIIYNVALLLGLVMLFAGVWLQAGIGAALVVVGMAVIGLTLYGAAMTGKR